MIATAATGFVRAFEPRLDPDGYHCRGRLPRKEKWRGATTQQCGARLAIDQPWCGRCGGLVAWGGSVVYRGSILNHLQTAPR